MKDVSTGQVVMMRGFKRTVVNDTFEATFTYPAEGKKEKSRYDVFLFLGNVSRDKAKTFDANKMLEAMGWKFVGHTE